jgi:hypothetical protein
MRIPFVRLGLRRGVLVTLILIIATTLTLGRLAGPASLPPLPAPEAGVGATSGADRTAGDDGVRVTPGASAYSTSVAARASEFMTVWLRRHETAERWREAIAALGTRRLADSLAGVDPLGVPATRVVSGPVTSFRSATVAEATFVVDSGTVTLTLLETERVWLVDGVDWQRA